MKKVFYPLACCCLAAGVFASCGGQKKANAQEEPSKVALSYSKSLKAPAITLQPTASRNPWTLWALKPSATAAPPASATPGR